MAGATARATRRRGANLRVISRTSPCIARTRAAIASAEFARLGAAGRPSRDLHLDHRRRRRDQQPRQTPPDRAFKRSSRLAELRPDGGRARTGWARSHANGSAPVPGTLEAPIVPGIRRAQAVAEGHVDRACASTFATGFLGFRAAAVALTGATALGFAAVGSQTSEPPGIDILIPIGRHAPASRSGFFLLSRPSLCPCPLGSFQDACWTPCWMVFWPPPDCIRWDNLPSLLRFRRRVEGA